MQRAVFHCEPCNKCFGSRRAIESHWTDSKRHSWCPQCDILFFSSEAAKSHWAQDHWICNDCARGFLSQGDLLVHYKTSPNHHLCGRCGKHYSTAAELSEHSLTHTSKEIKCWCCPKLFIGYAVMLAHLESELCLTTRTQMDRLAAEYALSDHYIIPGRKEYLLTGSRERFQSKPIFKRSTRSLGCDKCNRTFPKDENMAAHIRSTTHHPLAFKCPGCQTQFATLSALVAHIEDKTCSEGLSYGTQSVGKMLRHLWQNIQA